MDSLIPRVWGARLLACTNARRGTVPTREAGFMSCYLRRSPTLSGRRHLPRSLGRRMLLLPRNLCMSRVTRKFFLDLECNNNQTQLHRMQVPDRRYWKLISLEWACYLQLPTVFQISTSMSNGSSSRSSSQPCHRLCWEHLLPLLQRPRQPPLLRRKS